MITPNHLDFGQATPSTAGSTAESTLTGSESTGNWQADLIRGMLSLEDKAEDNMAGAIRAHEMDAKTRHANSVRRGQLMEAFINISRGGCQSVPSYAKKELTFNYNHQ